MSGRAKAAFLFLAILLVDQIVKLYVEAVMLPGESISVISSVFHITYVLNSGAAFGIFEHQRGLFLGVAAAFCIAFLGFYPRLRRSGSLIHYGSVALAAGAVSNMIDRMRTGHVVDFFDFRVWPVFNVADIAIVLGTAGVLWALFIQKRDLHR
ncbi:signal peptidase II [Selenomonas sp. F0473]|uniref:signal peptidase II n=1 Tax=Selenomonas sp. F0473 TaxID=999423 RepID=UPI00029E9A2D|nr:signal peptidase II [Selenomonas sp. F0473]EKU71798.1 signal peptidase II [Selenomonas sp. F0473]